jgi:protein-L-isoaspartate(D-aspartate) O-methyltransferase
MVETQIERRGIKNPRVLEAMRRVPRHLFVPEPYRKFAYRDAALPIGKGQSISQPYLVALMTELLEPRADHKVLEIGTGSGYHAAVVSQLVETVYTIELISELAERARAVLAAEGYENVVVIRGDGYRGRPEEAPFDGILVTAAPEKVPEPLLEQLSVGGRLVIPVGGRYQELKVLERTEEGVRTRTLLPVRFVPMVRP